VTNHRHVTNILDTISMCCCTTLFTTGSRTDSGKG